MGYSIPGFPVLHCLLEFAQIHVHWVSAAIQPSGQSRLSSVFIMGSLHVRGEGTVFLWPVNLASESEVAQSCPTLCDPMCYSIPGFPVLHYLLQFAQTHGHWISDAIQLSHPLSPHSPHALNLSQHWGLFQWVSFSIQVAKVLELELQHQSFHEYLGLISFRIAWFDLLALQRILKRLLQHNSKASVLQCSSFFILSHICTWLLEKP